MSGVSGPKPQSFSVLSYLFTPDKLLLSASLFYLGTKAKSTPIITLAIFVFSFNIIFSSLFAIGWGMASNSENTSEDVNRNLFISSSVSIFTSVLIAFFYTRRLK